MTYIPGKPLLLSRLPAREWFSVAEAAQYSGWGRSYVTDRIKDGTLPAQEYQKPEEKRAKGKGKHSTYRIHVDDLVLFIINNSAGRINEEKHFSDVAMIIRRWPAWMRRELLKFVDRTLSPKPPQP